MAPDEPETTGPCSGLTGAAPVLPCEDPPPVLRREDVPRLSRREDAVPALLFVVFVLVSLVVDDVVPALWCEIAACFSRCLDAARFLLCEEVAAWEDATELVVVDVPVVEALAALDFDLLPPQAAVPRASRTAARTAAVERLLNQSSPRDTAAFRSARSEGQKDGSPTFDISLHDLGARCAP